MQDLPSTFALVPNFVMEVTDFQDFPKFVDFTKFDTAAPFAEAGADSPGRLFSITAICQLRWLWPPRQSSSNHSKSVSAIASLQPPARPYGSQEAAYPAALANLWHLIE